MQTVTVVKIGGQVLDNEKLLNEALVQFTSIPGQKILVHGGGKAATDIANRLSLPQTMIEGRRVTDPETLKVAVMVYGGLLNKSVVAKLQAMNHSAMGMCGADANLLLAKIRDKSGTDYGLVGDIVSTNENILISLLKNGVTPVIAPITHDGKGQLLNTNADTIAQTIATALAKSMKVHLIYTFEKSGVLRDINDENSVISQITPSQYSQLKNDGKIFAGMIPKLDNAFEAIRSGVERVSLGKANELLSVKEARSGTTLLSEEGSHG